MYQSMAHPDSKAQMRRFLIFFPLCLAAGFALLQTHPVAIVVARFTSGLVGISGALIHLFGGKAAVDGVVLASPEGFAVRVENGCNAINVTILLWSAILVYPAPWIEKLKGLAAGSLVLHAINLLRIISLYYLGRYNQGWFEFAHLYLWESLIVVDTLVIFWGWAVVVRRSVFRRNAPTG
jgi:exosortase H (IPTLxxWG-CTERM-specific)